MLTALADGSHPLHAVLAEGWGLAPAPEAPAPEVTPAPEPAPAPEDDGLQAVAIPRYAQAEVVGQGHVTGETVRGQAVAHLAEDDLLVIRLLTRGGRLQGISVHQLVGGVLEPLSPDEIAEFVSEGLLLPDCLEEA